MLSARLLSLISRSQGGSDAVPLIYRVDSGPRGKDSAGSSSPRCSGCLQQQQRGSLRRGSVQERNQKGWFVPQKCCYNCFSSPPSCCSCWGPLQRGRAASPVPRELTPSTALGKRRGQLVGQTRPSTGAVPSLQSAIKAGREAWRDGDRDEDGDSAHTSMKPPLPGCRDPADASQPHISTASFPPCSPTPNTFFFLEAFWPGLNHPQN